MMKFNSYYFDCQLRLNLFQVADGAPSTSFLLMIELLT